MKRVLIICNTYYQLIVAIKIKETILKNESVTLMLSDHSNGAKQVSNRLKKLNFFNEVFWVENKGIIEKRTYKDRIDDFFSISFGSNNRYGYYLKDVKNKYFDEIVSFNYNIDIYGLYSILSKKNKYIKYSQLDEGILSYRSVEDTRSRKIIRLMWRFVNRPVISDNYGNFYCFYPEVYKGELNKVKLLPISNHDVIIPILRKIFDAENICSYKEKYIFFTSVYDFEGGEPVGEYDLVCKVAKLVGKDNLLIKTHPRDTRTIYKDNGFKVDRNSSIPWEVIQLSGDFSDKVFMTINSGSVLSGSTMSEKPNRIYFMYKLCDIRGNFSCQRNAHDMENILSKQSMKSVLKTVKIAERLEDVI